MLATITYLLALFAAVPRSEQVPAHGCDPNVAGRLDTGPVTEGPLRLAFVSCMSFQNGDSSQEPAVSPDGTRVARWSPHGPEATLEAVTVEGNRMFSLPNRVTFDNFSQLGDAFGSSPPALAWARDSGSLWTVRQQLALPSGWVLSGLQPLRVGSDGRVRELPALRHPAGPLDGLLWIGGEGLALAQFGTRGRYYRPEHEDSAPTLAFVDASRGSVLQSFRVDRFSSLRERLAAHGLMVRGATGTILPDGRARAVLHFFPWSQGSTEVVNGQTRPPVRHPSLWLLWTQGERPVALSGPLPDDRANAATFTPDGSKMLVARELQPEGVRVSCRIPCPHLQGPPPRPVTGTLVELFDLPSGRSRWRVPARVDNFWNQNAPHAVSPDGRYALVQAPPENGRLPLALVRMRDGRIVQKISPFQFGSYRHGFGFTARGRRVWVASGNLLLVYDVRGSAR